jgi:hypothetical protein
MRKILDPQDLKALLRLGDPARELDAGKAERVRRNIAAAVARGPAPSGSGLRWDLRLFLATASVAVCALALVIGLGREAPAPQAPAARRVQIDFATPGGTRIVWTLLREEPGMRRIKTRRGR